MVTNYIIPEFWKIEARRSQIPAKSGQHMNTFPQNKK